MAKHEHSYTPSEKIKRLDFETICEWIKTAWTLISPELVSKASDNVVAFQNMLNGSEDDEL